MDAHFNVYHISIIDQSILAETLRQTPHPPKINIISDFLF